MDRADVVRAVAARAGDALIIANLGSNAYDLYNHGHRPGNLYLRGGMGLTGSVGLGLALARPERRVMVLDGDGSLLMNLGQLATVAAEAPANLIHVVLVNGLWQETGGQRIATAGRTDLAAMARGAGIAEVAEAADPDALARVLDRALRAPGPWLIAVRIEERGASRAPDTDPMANRDEFMRAAAAQP
jgi:thiamine pyrophosphate-dependent acetolactate synthase large subunit-like protein